MRLKMSGGLALAAIAIACSGAANAKEDDATWKWSGFVTVVGGAVLGGDYPEGYHGPISLNKVPCPCYLADWSNAGVYGSSPSVAQESHAGVQVEYAMSPRVKWVGQAVARGNGAVEVAGAYAQIAMGEDWELSLGRKRIPLYMYSNISDVGFVYPWLSPPPELYGWDATYFNGAALGWSKNVGGWDVSASVFGGGEKDRDSQYYRVSGYPDTRTEVAWTNLRGATFDAAKGSVAARFSALRANTKAVNAEEAMESVALFEAVGAAIVYDKKSWFASAEAMATRRSVEASPSYGWTSLAYSVGVGARHGNWVPYVSMSQYKEASSDLSRYDPEWSRRYSATLRYNLDSNSALKMQVDRNEDKSLNYGGSSTVLRVSWDRMFF